MNDLQVKMGDPLIEQIWWNKDEVEELAYEIRDRYKGLVYTADNIQVAKQDRADLNKFIGKLEEKRKEVKRIYETPCKKFEKEIKDVEQIINEQIAEIDVALKEYETNRKEEKLEAIKELFESKQTYDFVTLEKIMDQKWLNISVSMKKVEAEMDEKLEKVENDVRVIEGYSEFESMILLTDYKHDLSMSNALNRLYEVRDYIAKNGEPNNSTTDTEKSVENDSESLQTHNVEREDVLLQLNISAPEFTALTQWLKGHGIAYLIRIDERELEEDIEDDVF